MLFGFKLKKTKLPRDIKLGDADGKDVGRKKEKERFLSSCDSCTDGCIDAPVDGRQLGAANGTTNGALLEMI